MSQQVVDTNLYRWQGMHSIWGQLGVGYEGACYADLMYSPSKYIKVVGEDAPPVQVWELIYNRIPPEMAQWWIAFLRQHIIPDEMLSQFTITRVKTKKHWPEKILQKRMRYEILDDIYYNDEEVKESDTKGRYAGCVPWVQLDLNQTLSARAIFALGNFFRYASEHGAVIAATKTLIEMEIPGLTVDQALILGQFMGGAKGHAVGGFGYLVADEVRKKTETFQWKERFAHMLKDPPFYKVQKRTGDIDPLFKPDWSKYMDVGFNPGFGTFTYNGVSITTRVSQDELNRVMAHWIEPPKKRKAVKSAK